MKCTNARTAVSAYFEHNGIPQTPENAWLADTLISFASFTGKGGELNLTAAERSAVSESAVEAGITIPAEVLANVGAGDPLAVGAEG